MSLISGVIPRDLSLRLVTHSGVGTPATDFNGGTPMGSGGLIVYLDQALNPLTDAFINGFRYTAGGALYCNTGGAPVAWPGGIPVNATGEVLVALNGTPATYVAGLPLNLAERLCVTVPD